VRARRRDLNAIYVTGPGHAGPGLVASAYLDGTYSEVYPHIGRDEEGLHRLFRQFSFPGGIPSHVAPETPGSIHEGGELGTRCCTPAARRSTTPICRRCAWSETARRRQDRLPPAGTRTSSSTRRATAPCCRCCTSTGTRLPTRRCSRGSLGEELKSLFQGHGYEPQLTAPGAYLQQS
jgi:hypothetical protein